jgi:protein O-GlcNAc transferase
MGSQDLQSELAAADALRQAGRWEELIALQERLAREHPDLPSIHNNLGLAYKTVGRITDAISALRRAVELAPQSPQAWNNYANILRQTGALDEAIAAYQRILSLSPNHVPTMNNLATALHDSGHLFEAIDLLRQAILVDPTHVDLNSNLLYILHFDPRLYPQSIRHMHQVWNERHARSLRSVEPFANDKSPDRILRIGYVSAHFGAHVIGRFMTPLLREHDSTQFAVTCYPPVEDLPQRMRIDRIDIAVDLDMHLAGGKPQLFARKLAPIQVTYLGYVAGAGNEAIDYRFSDPYLDPPGWDERYIEKTIRLPATYWCYEPPVRVDIRKTDRDGVTFGCLNNFAKAMPQALPVWGEILRRVPDSKLMIAAPSDSAAGLAIKVLGVDPSRVVFARFQAIEKYFALYNNIDVALDPFPYAGGTTTCDALYMGVPVVTLAGKTSVSRGGVSILSNLGLPELIAQTPDQYIEIAASVPRVPNLRDRMKESPLMDAKRFARDVESAYRQMWRDWCAT